MELEGDFRDPEDEPEKVSKKTIDTIPTIELRDAIRINAKFLAEGRFDMTSAVTMARTRWNLSATIAMRHRQAPYRHPLTWECVLTSAKTALMVRKRWMGGVCVGGGSAGTLCIPSTDSVLCVALTVTCRPCWGGSRTC